MAINLYFENGIKQCHYLIDTTTIFYFQNFTIYRFSTINQLETDKPIAGSSPYFIMANASQQGYLLTNLSDTKGKLIKADTVLKYYGVQFNKINISDFEKEWRPVSKDQENINSITETFVPYKLTMETVPDTIQMSYSKEYNDCSFSISKELDSLKAMKFIKLNMIFKQKTNNRQEYIPARNNFIQIEKSSEELPKNIIDYLKNKFKE